MRFEHKLHYKLSFYAVNILKIEAKTSQNVLQNTKMSLKVPEGSLENLKGVFCYASRLTAYIS